MIDALINNIVDKEKFKIKKIKFNFFSLQRNRKYRIKIGDNKITLSMGLARAQKAKQVPEVI